MYNNNMNNKNMIEVQRQESLKRRWHDSFYTRLLTSPHQNFPNPNPTSTTPSSSSLIIRKPPHHQFLQPGRLDGGDLFLNVVPSITVVLEGRSICHRINLQHHANYQSLAMALRQMFMEMVNIQQNDNNDDLEKKNNNNNNKNNDNKVIDLSNAIPGYIVAYEDLENDLLLAGDLQWKDFVRVAKRIRILPVKSSSRKQTNTKH